MTALLSLGLAIRTITTYRKSEHFYIACNAGSLCCSVWSQNPNLERLNDYKIAFFTRKMNLTSGEAEKFWPLYNEFQEKKRLIQENKAQINRNFNLNGQNMSDKELSDAADKYISLVMDEALLSQELNNKLKAILPPAKILRLYRPKTSISSSF